MVKKAEREKAEALERANKALRREKRQKRKERKRAKAAKKELVRKRSSVHFGKQNDRGMLTDSDDE